MNLRQILDLGDASTGRVVLEVLALVGAALVFWLLLAVILLYTVVAVGPR